MFPIALYEGGSGGGEAGTLTFTGFHIYKASLDDGFSLVGKSAFPDGLSAGPNGRSFVTGGGISMVGGEQLVLRTTTAPSKDVKRINLE